MSRYFFLTFAFIGLVLSGGVQAQTKVIHAGTLLARADGEAQSSQTIIVRDGRIAEILDGFQAVEAEDGESVEVIDLSDHFVMAGLIDSHTHILGELGPRAKQESVETSDELITLRGADNALDTVRAGFTTIRNLGGGRDQIFALRDGIARGYVPGPRILAAGYGVSVTGGHGDIDGYRADLMDFWQSPDICDGPYECRAATRRSIKFGADVIKIQTTGGVLSDTATGTGQQMKDDEIREITSTAHALGRKVAAHAHGTEGIIAALEGGIDSIEHGTYTDERAIALFNETGAYLVPTLLAGATVVRIAEEQDFFPPAIREKALRVGRDLVNNIGAAYEGGVKIAFGTDSGVSPHGENAQEFLLLRDIGMSNREMLTAATLSAADLLGIADETGSVEAGKAADIIAVDGNPLEDIETLLDVDFVMARGNVVKHP